MSTSSWNSEEEEGYPCDICDRVFETPNGLRVHSLSRVHQDKNVRCPNCARNFRTPSHLFMHFEQGKCINISRPQITSAVRNWEAATRNRNLLTVPRIGWNVENEGYSRVTGDQFNGYFFECPMCSKEFKKHYHMLQHANSPAHDSKDYHCRRCGLECKLLSSLFQHFESGKCGAINVQTGQGLMSNMGYKRLVKYFNSITLS